MSRSALLIALVLAALPALAVAADADKHSGSVVSVDPRAHTLVVEELGAGGKPQKLNVKVQRGTNLVLSERDPHAADFQHVFKERPITLDEIRPGDFVVVRLGSGGGAAESVMVTYRAGR
jgi:hypothetical protein